MRSIKVSCKKCRRGNYKSDGLLGYYEETGISKTCCERATHLQVIRFDTERNLLPVLRKKELDGYVYANNYIKIINHFIQLQMVLT